MTKEQIEKIVYAHMIVARDTGSYLKQARFASCQCEGGGGGVQGRCPLL